MTGWTIGGPTRSARRLGRISRQGKPTLPLLRLLATSEASQRQELTAMLSDEGVGESHTREIVKWLESSDASEYTLKMATNCANLAIEQLRDLPDSAAKSCLHRIAKFSVSRVT